MVSPILLLRECFVCLTVFVIALSRVTGGFDLVEEVCSRDSDYQFCLTTLNGNHETVDADRYKLAAVAFQMAYLNAKSSLNYIDNLLKDTSGDATLRGHLQQCRGDYDHATRKFLQGCNDINSETYDILGSYATAAGKDADDCRSVFGNNASPLDDNNRNLKGYSQIGAAVATLFA